MNPGLYARSRYGPGYLRHAQSWRYEGLGTAYDNYESGSWKNVRVEFFLQANERASSQLIFLR